MIARYALAASLAASPAVAQHHHAAGDPAPAPAPAPQAGPAPAAASPGHAGHDAATPPSAGPAVPPPSARPAGPGDAPAPDAPADHAADLFYSPAQMRAARRTLAREHGGMTYHLVMLDSAEWQVRNGRDAYRWDAEGWFGGDLNRLVVRSEGSGAARTSPDDAEVQALYSRAIDPYWNLQGGIRQDLTGRGRRTWATVAVEGLAPYWFEVEGSLFLSDRGELAGRLSAYYDQRITQALILQPRVEFNLAAQDSRARRQGRGLSSTDLDLRLRYEIRREFAPYVGVTHSRLSGGSARYARADGNGTHATSLVLGLRAWF